MAWIRIVPPEAATGRLRSIYEAAIRRAGKVFQILQVQSLHPRALHASTRLYLELMLAPGGALARYRREMIALAVSRANRCHY